MVQKRSFVDDVYKVSSKHPRKLEHSNQLVSFLEFPSSEDVVQKPHTSGEGEGVLIIAEHSEKFGSGNITELPICTEKAIENSPPGCISNTSSAPSSTSEEDFRLEAPIRILFSPDYYTAGCPIRTVVHSEDIYCSLLEHAPRKLVPIGPDFQANIPEWCAHGAKDTSSCSDSAEPSTLSRQDSEPGLVDCIDDENKFIGTCVIQMPEVEPSACEGDKFGAGRIDCCCDDLGSVRCVRQHIMEARENLRGSLGQESFVELGFCDMGEVVAEKWSEDDGQLFHDVVFSHPASLGKNFWDYLSAVFPLRTKKEIVSYYFNVFMLQTRAEQNRCDPMNIDSDNDEWQGSDDEVGIFEGDEDSVVESLLNEDDPSLNEIHEDGSHEYNEGIAHTTSDYYEDVDFDGFKGITDVLAISPRKLLDNCSSDDSCTSSNPGPALQVNQVKVGSSKHWAGTFNGTNGGDGHEFVLEPCDAKVWDVGYLACPRNKVDLLPTCSMIEEVFGVGAWNCKARDGEGLS